jgi:hypothetical protein
MFTYQDFLQAQEKGAAEQFIVKVIDSYIASREYARILMAERYYNGENPALSGYHTKAEIGGSSVDLFARIRVPSGIFNRLITLQVNRLWHDGVQLDDPEKKKQLGSSFDKIAKDISTNAAVHGVCYGFWNLDKLVMFTAKEFLMLRDERTGIDMVGLRFWRLSPNKPWVIQLYEIDGWTEFSRVGTGPLRLVSEKRAYTEVVRRDALGETVFGENYPRFPVIAMYANTQRTSELSAPIKAKIDLYDAIMTTFGDTVLRTKAVYWILEGMSGSIEHLREARDAIERLGIIAPNGDVNAKAETVDLPYQATIEFLSELEKSIFRDAMVTNPQELMGSNLTATAINASYHAEKLKVSDMEWQAAFFIDALLNLIGIENNSIKFKHEAVSSDMEITQRLNMYSELPMEIKVKIDPLFSEDIQEMVLESLERKDER